jgi:hypothetical protein
VCAGECAVDLGWCPVSLPHEAPAATLSNHTEPACCCRCCLSPAEERVKLAAGTPSDCQHTPSSDLPASQPLARCQHAAGDCQGSAPPLIQLPDWLANLAKATANIILGQPDTFRWGYGGCHTLCEAPHSPSLWFWASLWLMGPYCHCMWAAATT